MKKKILSTFLLLFFILAPIMLFGCITEETDPDDNNTTPPVEATIITSISDLTYDFLLYEPFAHEGKNNPGSLVTLTYNNNTTEDVAIRDLMITSFDSASFGLNKMMLISYKGKSMNCFYNVKTEMENVVHNFPSQLRFYQSTDSFTFAFDYAVWKRDNNTIETRSGTRTSSGFNISNLDTEILGNRDAIFSFGGASYTHNYTVSYMQNNAAVSKTVITEFSIYNLDFDVKLENFKLNNDGTCSGKIYVQKSGEPYSDGKDAAYMYLGECNLLTKNIQMANGETYTFKQGDFEILSKNQNDAEQTKNKIIGVYSPSDNTFTILAGAFRIKPNAITQYDDNDLITINLS